jgi:hypothetical protein
LIVVSSFIFILVTGSILTDNAPTWARLVGIIPLAALLIALVLNEFFNLLERISLRPLIPLLVLGMGLFLVELAVADWNNYVNWVENETRPVVRVARYLSTLPPDITACGITEGFPMNQEEVVFLGWPRPIVNVPPETAQLNSTICPGRKLVWILSPAYQGRLSELLAQWPGGTVENHLVKTDLVFTSYLVSTGTVP